MRLLFVFLFGMVAGFFSCSKTESDFDYEVDVLIIGGGASGTMAGIQSARLGVNTLIVEETPWLGGMLTSAGVSAIDGNHKLHSGLWAEFRQKIYDFYGGPENVNTGWVSQVLFEPSVGATILEEMAKEEKKLDVLFNTVLLRLKKNKNGWLASFSPVDGQEKFRIKSKILIDGTELGDVAKMAGVSYDIGMDSRADTGEKIAPEKANKIVQDLTYIVILEDFGKGADKTIARPENYDSTAFLCTCKEGCNENTDEQVLWDCDYMMEYGRLPNNKYMINWPINGNDFYTNIIEMSKEERDSCLEIAKWHSRCYVYYLQNELGYKNLGIATKEFPSHDGFPLYPYHRESRRIKGEVRFTINDLARPFNQLKPLYRTGIAVGDYAVDHHHSAYPEPRDVPDLHFYPVPSYTIPFGALIPENQDYLIVAEKSISVTNIVNGTTRLQPVCMLIGQASGVIAALAVKDGVTPANVQIRNVQQTLLEEGAYIQPYSDVMPDDLFWLPVQCIGSTGIIKGEGKNQGWANLTLFHPDSAMTSKALLEGIKELIPGFEFNFKGNFVTAEEAGKVAIEMGDLIGTCKKTNNNILQQKIREIWKIYEFGIFQSDFLVSRCQMAVILHEIADLFKVEINLEGKFKLNTQKSRLFFSSRFFFGYKL